MSRLILFDEKIPAGATGLKRKNLVAFKVVNKPVV